jgi:hypothetical protein
VVSCLLHIKRRCHLSETCSFVSYSLETGWDSLTKCYSVFWEGQVRNLVDAFKTIEKCTWLMRTSWALTAVRKSQQKWNTNRVSGPRIHPILRTLVRIIFGHLALWSREWRTLSLTSRNKLWGGWRNSGIISALVRCSVRLKNRLVPGVGHCKWSRILYQI